MACLSRICRPLRALTACAASLLAAGCGAGDAPRTLLDAAEIYAANEAVLESIPAAYPGPYDDFTRIPARDPGAATANDAAFLKALRKNFPVEHIDLFPIGGEGAGDEINVVLNRYGAGDEWRTVSLVYFSTPMTLNEHQDMRMFETCDEEALDWLTGTKEPGRAAFCRINDNWQAYQRID